MPLLFHMKKILSLFLLFLSIGAVSAQNEHSVARQWNEVLLDAIRVDFARPTVHARNLFHTSTLMYDAWAVYDDQAIPYFLGNDVHGYVCDFSGIETPTNLDSARNVTLSYAVYRLLLHRFENSPGADATIPNIHNKMIALGYDTAFVDTDYSGNSYGALGNYMAEQMIAYGLQDGSNEADGYANQYYTPVNPTIVPVKAGNPDIINPNRWQPISLDTYIDQSGNVLVNSTPEFLSPEWGHVQPFSLDPLDSVHMERDGHSYPLYFDPGTPPHLDDEATSEYYKWNFELVSIWSSHLDPADGVMWDISPASLGNIQDLPADFTEYDAFYDLLNGGDPSQGHTVNPHTGQPYEPQTVPRGDYARVLAEFWADGPDSETPPGHWFTILNYVNDHPEFDYQNKGLGQIESNLEWDVKAYFTLGGAMHDAAITAWGIKGYYDYLRPISAIRHMADNGQCSDSLAPNYSRDGINLVPGYIELVDSTDDLAGDNHEHVGKIKVYAWQGPGYISFPSVDIAEVGWILAENWWPYQRPSFVTPPFAGYVSGHSVFSRSAAEVMTFLTDDAYFPGGMGEFLAKKDEFLIFEDGPSVDVTLQWATYRDASDQTSLSRIWGGIHPPVDDIPGRLIGIELGKQAFDFAQGYFNEPKVLSLNPNQSGSNELTVYPNPLQEGNTAHLKMDPTLDITSYQVINNLGQVVIQKNASSKDAIQLATQGLSPGFYILRVNGKQGVQSVSIIVE